jgi:hypothetical protein
MPEPLIHSLTSGFVAALGVGIFFLLRGVYNRRQRHRESKIVSVAAKQMRQTAILLKIGLHADEDEIRAVQQQLHDRGMYPGEPTGIMDQTTLEGIEHLAESRGVDLDKEVESLFGSAPRDDEESREAAAMTAIDRLAESNQPPIYFDNRRDRLA